MKPHLILVIVLVGSALLCITPACISREPLRVSQTPLPMQGFTPVATKQFQTPEATLALIPKENPVTSTATLLKFGVVLLRGWQLGDEGRFVATAFWSQDGNTVFYALDTYGDVPDRSAVIEWFAIDLHSREEHKLISSPMIIYPPGLDVSSSYPQYAGFVSPSGRYRFDLKTNITGFYNRPDDPKSTLWLIDTFGEQPPIKVLETDVRILQREAYWHPGEREVVFSVTIGEVGIELYSLDLDTEKVVPFLDTIGIDDTYLLEWALSPDGEKFAIVDYQGLRILSLKGETLAKFSGDFYHIRWSINSQLIYYFQGAEQKYVNQEIYVYNLKSGKSKQLLSMAELEAKGISGFFDFSPQGNQVIFWGDQGIWLVELSQSD